MQTRIICIYNNTLLVRVGKRFLHISLNQNNTDVEYLIDSGIPVADDDTIEQYAADDEALYLNMEAKMQEEYWETDDAMYYQQQEQEDDMNLLNDAYEEPHPSEMPFTGVYIMVKLGSEDLSYVAEIVNKIMLDPNFDEEYEYAGNFCIAPSEEEWENACSPCCGTFAKPIELPHAGGTVYFCFDYGH